MRHQSSLVMEHAPGASAVLLLEEGELGAEATVKKFSTVRRERNREVRRELAIFYLKMIIYRYPQYIASDRE